jgi:hypothetical protein
MTDNIKDHLKKIGSKLQFALMIALPDALFDAFAFIPGVDGLKRKFAEFCLVTFMGEG